MPIPSEEVSDDVYVLSQESIKALQQTFHEVLHSNLPHVFLFASCYSQKSEIINLMTACGLFPTLFITSEKGLITGQLDFQLDDQQKALVAKFAGVSWSLIRK